MLVITPNIPKKLENNLTVIQNQNIMAESSIQTLYDNKDTKCKNSECGHIMDSHLNFKNIGETRIPLLYCSECRAEGKECKLTKF